jgi:hypothetical protein
MRACCRHGGRDRAQRALRWATWLDPALSAPAEAVVPDDGSDSPASGAHVPGNAHPGGTRAWPPLDDAQRAEAVRELKAQSVEVFDAMGAAYTLFESPFFLLYSDLPAAEARARLHLLDTAYSTLLRVFDLPEAHNIFWGKAVVIIHGRREGFVELERIAFGASVPGGMEGVSHPIGPKVVVNFWRLPDEHRLEATLVHEVTHGFMHRYRSGMELPLWLEEGFADCAAEMIVPDCPIDAHRRGPGFHFVRRGGPVENVLDIECIHEAWSGPDQGSQAAAYLLVRMMSDADPGSFKRLIDMIKDGREWEPALREATGMTRRELVEAFVRRCGEDD